MRFIFIIAVLLIYCSCDKTIYPEDNLWRCWSCELKQNGSTIKFDTCFNGSVYRLLLDSTGKLLEGSCYVK